MEHIRIRVENGPAGLLAGNWFILQQWRVKLLLQGRVDSTNGDNQSGRFLKQDSVNKATKGIVIAGYQPCENLEKCSN